MENKLRTMQEAVMIDLQEGNFENAVEILKNILLEYPNDKQSVIFLCQMYIDNEKNDLALNLISQYVEKYPDDNDYKLWSAITYEYMENASKSKLIFEELYQNNYISRDFVEGYTKYLIEFSSINDAVDFCLDIIQNHDEYQYAEAIATAFYWYICLEDERFNEEKYQCLINFMANHFEFSNSEFCSFLIEILSENAGIEKIDKTLMGFAEYLELQGIEVNENSKQIIDAISLMNEIEEKYLSENSNPEDYEKCIMAMADKMNLSYEDMSQLRQMFENDEICE